MKLRGPRVHDPERDAASYVSGEQRPRERRGFEAHLLECDRCWREVAAGREGRRVAEAARELAPAELREDVRAAVLMSEPGRRHRRAPLAAPVVALVLATSAVAVIGVLRGQSSEPAPIAAAITAYHSAAGLSVGATIHPAPDLSSEGLRLIASWHGSLGGLPSDTFSYRDPTGHRVVVILSSRTFPRALGATSPAGPMNAWRADSGGLSLICGDGPIPYLLVGADRALLARVQSLVVAADTPTA